MGEPGTHEDQNAATGYAHPAANLRVGDFLVDLAARRLTRGGRRVRIQHKPLDVLIYLASHHTRMVTREELLREFWPRTVNEEVVTRCISTIRKLLGDIGDSPRYIETFWGQGYRLVAPVEWTESSAKDPAITEANRPGRPGWKRRTPWLLALLLAVGSITVGLIKWRAPAPPADSAVERIAVMPIAAPDHEPWIADALTDHLVRTLARIEGITVVASGSRAALAGVTDPGDLGRQLGVEAVLKSNLRQGPEVAEMHSRLISAADGSILWTYSLETDLLGPAEAEVRQLAQAMARQLWAKLQLRGGERQVNPAAYRHYLRGRYHWNQRSAPSLLAAIDSFNSALAIEPEYVDALTGQADTWLVMPLYGAVEPSEAIPRARVLAEQALQLDAAEAHARAVLGVINMQYDWDWLEAESQLLQAVKLNPSDVTAVQWLGELYCYRKRWEECWRHLKVAAGLDPLSPVMAMIQGSPYLWSWDFSAAVDAYKISLAQAPDFMFTTYALGLAHAGAGQWEEAARLYQVCLPELGLAIVGGPLVFALAKVGQESRAADLLAQLEQLTNERYVPPTKLATAYLGMGDRPRALAWLHRAVETHDDRLVYLAVDAHFKDLYGDPEFQRIAATVGMQDIIGR